MRTTSFLLFAAFAVAPIGCGGSSGSSGPMTGQLIDSAVQGVDFDAGGTTGTTDAQGGFTYAAGGSVTFSLGQTTLGMATGAPRVTPVDLVAGAVDETNQTVTNIARYLQTLDGDADPTNGISISQATRTAVDAFDVNFAQTTAAFTADATVASALSAAGAPPLVSAAAAQSHLRGSLFGNLAGRYQGTYGGDDSGTFSLLITRTGALIGWGNSNTDGFFNYTGTFPSSGSSTFGGQTSGSAVFTGAVSSGVISGSWNITGPPVENGTFSGMQFVTVDPTLDPAIVQQIAGTYTGTATQAGNTEPITFAVSSAGDITITVNPPDPIEGVLQSTSGTGAVLIGLSDDASVIQGTIDLAGNLSGTSINTVFGESGTFTATKI